MQLKKNHLCFKHISKIRIKKTQKMVEKHRFKIRKNTKENTNVRNIEKKALKNHQFRRFV